MTYADRTKAREYSKLRNRKIRNSKLANPDKSILEQMYDNLRKKEKEDEVK